jgi:hypothetical protein
MAGRASVEGARAAGAGGVSREAERSHASSASRAGVVVASGGVRRNDGGKMQRLARRAHPYCVRGCCRRNGRLHKLRDAPSRARLRRS